MAWRLVHQIDNRISHNIIISSAFPALKLLCCFSSRSTFSTTIKDVLPLTISTLSNLVYSVTCVCERRYIGKTTHKLSERIKQHVPLTLINAGLALRRAGRSRGVLSLPTEEQVVLAKQIADFRSDSANTRHLRSNRYCLIAVCSHVFDLFSVVARGRNHLHLDVLEAVYIKLHSPVLCQQKEYAKVLYLVWILRLCLTCLAFLMFAPFVIHNLYLGVYSWQCL